MNSIEILKRLKDFDEMISNPSIRFSHKYVLNHRSEYADIGIATFNRDIKKLKDLVNQRYGELAELYDDNLLKNDRKSASYYYALPNIRAFDDLNTSDSQKLIELLNTVIQLFPENEALIQKITAKINVNYPNKENKKIHWDPLQLIFEGKRSGSHYLKELLDYILQKKPIKISYGLKEYRILPVLIKEYHNGWYASWYVLAKELETNSHLTTSVSTKGLRCFAVEKIVKISQIKEQINLDIKPDFNPGLYFKNILGIWRKNIENLPHDPPTIEVKFKVKKDSWIKNYLTSHPIHFSQVLVNQEDGSQIGHICIEDTEDLTNLFIKYADQFTVLEPLNLREKIKNSIRKSLEEYK
ncbi:WYL domain-containing protein [Sandaracinomonas limnophila]|uniref:WYL domain-containing protein n=1 Tax=Sandaracinomonas limnophila TaxID=1862386 RepID=A0A437PS23_9BACT|nr:WYL domain-containing protein [Sandaracinomonas limnophila]RVU25064.1 WYL domain-containing protein [Sandaracinomonas limnophila]